MTLELRHVTKTFGAQAALSDVDLSVSYGEVHALVGQNGSGKSTLIKLLSGYHQPDPGADARLGDRPFQLGSDTAAREAGLRFVHQDLALVLRLSVGDNMMLGRPYPVGRLGRIRRRQVDSEVRTGLQRVGLDIDPEAPVGGLGMAERTAVAIARALADAGDSARLVVLDEPTAALPPDEVGRLLATIDRLRSDGHGVLLVSHHLDEVLDVADRVTVLRDGRVAASRRRSEVDYASLTELIVGHPMIQASPTTAVGATGRSDRPSLLTVEGLGCGRLEHLDLELQSGQIVGVAGITGSGRESVVPGLNGSISRRGSVTVQGHVVPPEDPARAIAAGMVSIPGERARYGVFPNLDVRRNLTISMLGQHTKRGRIDRRAELQEVDSWIARLGIVTQGGDAPILSLSGGNQQKVLVARALRMKPAVLILDDPTQGIDIGARAQIHEVIKSCASEGMAILLASTDSDELALLSDHVLVLAGGRVMHRLDRGATLTSEAIDAAQLDASIDPPALAAGALEGMA